MYRLEHLCKGFADGTLAVDDVTLDIRMGERVAVIGPSGAGKSTLFRLLNATLRPTSGRLRFDGADLESLSGRQVRQLRRRIGTVYQQHNLVPQLRVIHNVLAGRLGHWSLPKALFSLLSPQERSVALAALGKVGIPEKLYSRTAHLSGGQQQRVAIARVLMQDPEVILADEPVSSVDPTLGRTIMELLASLAAYHQKTLVANLHAVSFALDFFPRVIGFRQGRVAFDLPSAAVSEKVLAELDAGLETSTTVPEYS
ncbi:MAG TPA: phosphonate ABC transporter ATP-binding protein [Candidatus Tectomicrobia bacterium]|nr:phosphonate ABC transporter ATP-binding protein [Candidatus Tectomicrobia bacterium]